MQVALSFLSMPNAAGPKEPAALRTNDAIPETAGDRVVLHYLGSLMGS